ncbi:MAG: toprim domain-containing protein [Sediminibacterium sp.]|nr:toprim domain-containing protein [Sediminibacterium sp.]
MEITDIKEQLSITAVLQYYGLKADRNGRVHCPFHADSTPSLQIYPKTNTYCCFSSNCNAGTGDAIQFIQLKEHCSKHEAITKAASLINGTPLPTAKLFIEAAPLEKIAVVSKLFKYFTKALPLTTKAVDYTASRAIDYKVHEIGCNSGDWHHVLKEKNFIKSCEQYGLLKPLAVKGYSVWARDCIIFALKNQDNKIVSLYGRSITDNEDSRHFYLTGREGLYPGYPELTTTRLILTESIIDAASLLQQEAIKSNYGVLALYGTNGLTDEHQQSIIALPQLEEIIFMLDADEAGDAAVNKHYSTFKRLLPEVRITKVSLPDGEDVNGVLQAHDDASILYDLIEQRKEIFVSIENKSPEIVTPPALQHGNKLNTQNPELLIYNDSELYIEVLGGIKITGLDRMKVTLKILHKDQTTLPVWHSLDLYNHGQREQAINSVADTFEHPITATATTIAALTSALEGYRLQRIEALQPKQEVREAMTAAERQAAISELKKPNLLQRTSQLIEQSGIVGETTNSLIAYLVYCTRKQHTPLHVMFLGASGSGKTYLQERISDLVPEEEKIEITQITENALYYFKQEELKHKLILIEDLDGAMSVFYPLRELQTKRKISKTVTLKDSKGNLKTITLTVEGPVCVSGCTTKEKLYEDNANRCILLYTDMSKDQDKLINGYQAKLAAGEVNRAREQQYQALFKNMQRVLQPMSIVNPYAKCIELPEQVFKPRRTMTLLLGFIEAITFYHQYQRTVKKDKAGNPCIESTVADIEAAFTLLKNVLFSKSDELTKATRDFLELLKRLLHESGVASFNAKQIRERLRINPSNMKRYLAELARYGYIKGSGNRYRGSYEYMIVNMEEYETLKSSIDGHLQIILDRISSSVVQ